MFSRIDVNLDCADVDSQAEYWSQALGYEQSGSSGPYRALSPPDGVDAPKLVLQHVPEPRVGKNRLHLDVVVGAEWIVMADPEGNEFCICAS